MPGSKVQTRHSRTRTEAKVPSQMKMNDLVVETEEQLEQLERVRGIEDPSSDGRRVLVMFATSAVWPRRRSSQ